MIHFYYFKEQKAMIHLYRSAITKNDILEWKEILKKIFFDLEYGEKLLCIADFKDAKAIQADSRVIQEDFVRKYISYYSQIHITGMSSMMRYLFSIYVKATGASALHSLHDLPLSVLCARFNLPLPDEANLELSNGFYASTSIDALVNK
jgi:hypothetical protein